jgi:hypothetical protein
MSHGSNAANAIVQELVTVTFPREPAAGSGRSALRAPAPGSGLRKA